MEPIAYAAPGCSPDNHAAFDRIPRELRERPQWALAGPDKAPRTVTGAAASSTDRRTWTDFATACRAASERNLFIGFMLSADDPLCCIDLDVKDSTSPEDRARFGAVIEAMDSYTERSRSGQGWHIWVEGGIGPGRRRDGIEVYSQERFIICTGNVFLDRPVAGRQPMLDKMVAQMAPPAPRVLLTGEDVPDEAVAEIANVDQGRLGRLWRGQWEGDFPSQSEADLALVSLLLPMTASPRACWATFRRSSLGRREKAGRADYMQTTLALAAQHLANDAAHAQHGAEVAANLLRQMAAAPASGRFRLLGDDDLFRLPAHRWLVKGILPETGIGTIFGQSGTFKSFVALDLLAHISNGDAWFGRKVTAAPAVYVPFEGQGGIPRRVAAWRLARAHDGQAKPSTNMRFITEPMNLRLAADRDELVTTLLKGGWAGGVLCIDTLAQAGPGIDENTSQGMGEMIAVFQELQQRLGGVVLVVHHSGKFEKAGMRGWSGLLGALDFALRCWRDEDWLWYEGQFVLDKVKDGECGTPFDFSMVRVTLGHDDDGDEITSLAVSPRQATEPERKPDEAEVAAQDDLFVELWLRRLVADGAKPTGRWLDAQRVNVKGERKLTQRRLRDAVDRLKGSGRLEETPGGPSNAKWLRPVDLAPHPAP